MRVKLYETHGLLVCADDVNLLDDYMDTMKKNTETVTDTIKEIDLELNAEKTKYICCLITRMQGKFMT
jgi:hypothetical protein